MEKREKEHLNKGIKNALFRCKIYFKFISDLEI